MLGQPASSHTVCKPSRRTSDFSSVYSGPVFSRVLIHSGLRSMGTWLLRTSRRSSLRPAGSSGEPEECAGAAVSLMIATVLREARRPRCTEATGASDVMRRSDLLVRRSCRRAGVGATAGRERLRGVGPVLRRAVRAVAVDELRVAHAHVGLRRGGVTGLRGRGDGLAGIARGTGHGVLSVAGDRTVARGGRGPGVVLLAAQDGEHGGTQREGEEHPRPPPRPLLGADLPLDRLGRGQRRLLDLAVLPAGVLAGLLGRLPRLAPGLRSRRDQLGTPRLDLAPGAVDTGGQRLAGALQG